MVKTMEVLINTKLDKYSFLGETAASGENSLEARCPFAASQFFTLVEAMARLASLHFRSALPSGRQTFLLKVKNLSPWLERSVLDGAFTLKADLLAKSRATGLYRVTATRPGGAPLVSGEFYISSIDRREFEDLPG